MHKHSLPLPYLDRVKASIADCSTDFIGIADTDGRLIYLNPAAYRLMGYGDDERPVFDTIADVHANDFDKFALEVIQPAVFQDGFWSGTGYLRHRDGHAITVAQQVFPVLGPDGAAYGTAAVMKDITAALRKDEQIRKNNALFQRIMDSAGIGMVLINMETNTIEMVNKFAEEMLQLPACDILHHKCYDILCHRSPELCPHINEKDKPSIVAERFIERPDGTALPIIKTGTWIRFDDKEYLLDTFVDITIQKDLEKNLFDAKLSAEAANRSKSEFLSRMSHEMRTPLNAIIGMTQIAGRTDSEERLRDAIKTIGVSSQHLLSLINDVLDMSKIEEGKLDLMPEPFSLSAMVQKMATLIASKAEEKKQRYLALLDASIPDRLVGDAMRLSQVLLNFLSNAVKFTPDGGEVTLRIEKRAQTEQDIALFFSVADTGIGITQEQLARLFAPFSQADGTISARFGGTGLGLVISRRIVQMMGADIAVSSVYGQGSTFSFTVTLPLAGASAVAEDTPDFGDIAGLFAGKRALLVDDVEINRLIAIELLQETGLAMDQATDGQQAVDMVTSTPYDLVFMDVQMPVMDGYAATRAIRALPPPAQGTPIIAMSANVFKEDIQASLAAGMNGHVGKPIDLDTMLTAAAKHLLSRSAEPAPAPEPKKAVTLRPGYADEESDVGLMRLTEALEALGGDESKLAAELDAFLSDTTYQSLCAAMGTGNLAAAEEHAAALFDRACTLHLSALSSYAGNVLECLRLGDGKYAEMYLADLSACYQPTREAIERILDR